MLITVILVNEGVSEQDQKDQLWENHIIDKANRI